MHIKPNRFTLIELLVVIAIVARVVTLLSSLDSLIKTAVETAGTEVAGVTVSLDSDSPEYPKETLAEGIYTFDNVGHGEYELGYEPDEKEQRFNKLKRCKKHLRNDLRIKQLKEEEEHHH